MRLLEESDQRFVGIEKKIGLFIAVAIIGIAAAVLYTGVRQDMFAPKTRIYFMAESGQGIKEGMSVKLSGFVIGKVIRSALEDVSKVRVDLAINKEYMKWVKTDSIAFLVKEGLIGEGIIEIIPGPANADGTVGSASVLPEGGMIAFERSADLNEMAEEVKREIKPILQDVREMVRYANNAPEGNVKDTLRNLNQFSGGLMATKGNIDALIGSTDRQITDTVGKLVALLDSARGTFGELNSTITRVDGDVARVMVKVDKSLDNVLKATEELKTAIEKTAPKVPALVEKGGETAAGAKEVLDSVKRIWPVSSHIERPKEKTLKVDSVE